MNQEQKDFLNLRHFPGVLSREQVAWRLGLNVAEIDILLAAGKLTPLGKPKKNSKKVFANSDVERCLDSDFLAHAQKCIANFWEKKNRSRKSRWFADAPAADDALTLPTGRNHKSIRNIQTA